MEDLSLDLCMYLKKMDYDGKHTYSFTYENNRNISGQRFVSPPLTKLFDVDRLCGRLPFLANAYHLRGCSMYRWNEMQFKRAIKYFPHLTCYVNRSFGRNSQTTSLSTPKHRTSMCIHGNRARRSQGTLT